MTLWSHVGRWMVVASGVALSALFAYAGAIGLWFAESRLDVAWWVFNAAYGLTNLALIGVALRRPRPQHSRAAAIAAAVMVGGFTAGSLDYWLISDHEKLGILGIGLAALVNWLSVRASLSLARSWVVSTP